MMASNDPRGGGRSTTALLVLGFVLLAANSIASMWFVELGRSDRRDIIHAFDVNLRLTSLLSAVQDAETGQRGYLLTENQSYLQPYDNGLVSIREQLTVLGEKLAFQSNQTENLSLLKTHINDKLAELSETIMLRRAGHLSESMAIVSTDKGKHQMDVIRSDINDMLSLESDTLHARQTEISKVGAYLQTINIIMTIGILILAVLVIDVNKKHLNDIMEARDALRRSLDKVIEEISKRKQVEEQLRHSQKLELIGQLSGGMAHDFNNKLTVIIGGMNLIKRRLERGETNVQIFMDEVVKSAERAAVLVNRLLAFSRQQPLDPQPIDGNKFIKGISDILHGSLGEHVRLETVLGGGLWLAFADPNQLEAAIINLAVNARDAMPNGGRLTMETANASLDEAYAAEHSEVSAGQYVMIAVTDTGEGMSPEVMEKAFEPFFTTKKAGEGTGLGLSQVYGFVKQSGGHVKIYSEIGQGTTFKLYLPRFVADAGKFAAIQKSTSEIPHGNKDEVILVVEDEATVLGMSVVNLNELGYTVLQASNAADALRIIDEHPHIKLLFTDVVMPDVNGKKLADEVARRKPEIKILFTTGYTRNAIIHGGILDAGVKLISKPFTLWQLAWKVREVLDSP